MALQEQPAVEVPLGGGPNESQGKLFRSPNVLEANDNGTTDKAGYLAKERGYRRPPITKTTHGAIPEAIFVSVATFDEELLMLGQANLYTVAASDGALDGSALILRGPSLLGNYRVGVVFVTSLSE